YRIKLLGIAKKTSKGVEQRVHPTLVPKNFILSNVDGVYNVILVQGNFVGNSIFIGQGAGSHPTASAVISDIVDLAKGIKSFCFGRKIKELQTIKTTKILDHLGPYYVRLMVKDKPGVFAKITNILKKKRISLKSVIQHDSTNKGPRGIPIIFTTYEAREKTFIDAIGAMKKIPDVIKDPVVLRIEQNF
ncbi:MAG: ACT domain-containing protein, partial [Pseudomonadota bacterium]|nr:ACT domain-containing protein [Pseudomonadota bacterium]